MSSFILNSIDISSSKNRIGYSYEVSKDIKKYFKEDFFIEYDTSIKDVPDSILIIPLLANVLPIAWMVGFDVIVDSIDSNFYEAVLEIKKVFSKEFPEIKNKNSTIRFKNLVENIYSHKKNAMLFSGGVDAYASYFNHQNESMDLILIRGADIPLDDKKQWETAKKSVDNEVILDSNQKHFITMNCRNFYTHKVDELIAEGSWWGSIQHGLSLICAISPLAYKNGYQIVYIASSYTAELQIFWGSMPEIDNEIKWANTNVLHDGYHMRRINKLQSIVRNSILLDKKINLRVCYSELNNGINCSNCEKCYRTIFGLALFNVNPNNFGFNVDYHLYDNIEKIIKRGFSSNGTKFFWRDILNTMKENKIFQFEDNYYPQQRLKDELKLALSLTSIEKDTKIKRFKKKLIYNFPNLFKKYLKIRRNLI